MLRIVVLFLIPVSWACKEEITSPNDSSSLRNFREIAQRLESAFQHQSQDELKAVFEAWQETIPPYTSEEMVALSDTIQQVYAIFQEFYSPTDLDRITGGAHENFETDFWYIVVQNNTRFAVLDTSLEHLPYPGGIVEEAQILDFRPPQGDLPFPVVYLSTQADSMIYQFLYQPDGTPELDHRDRVNFLRQAMQLTHHHWINDYHKATMPIVSVMYLNDSLTQARVDFRVFYQFGETYLERKDTGWTIISSELPMIE
jgi:hypothetical protein